MKAFCRETFGDSTEMTSAVVERITAKYVAHIPNTVHRLVDF